MIQFRPRTGAFGAHCRQERNTCRPRAKGKRETGRHPRRRSIKPADRAQPVLPPQRSPCASRMAARYRPVRQSGRPFPVRRTRRPPIVNGLRGRGSLRGHADESPYPSPQRRRPALFRAGPGRRPANSRPTELSPITVTAQRVPSDAATLPVAVSVITAEDIAASSARTMQDLLSTQAGIHLLNTSSSTDNAIVDLRGFGMTGASNTLILVDGVKQNTNDPSAPNPRRGAAGPGRTHRNRARQRLRAIRRRHHRRRDQHHHPPRLPRNRSPPAPPPPSAAMACASMTRPSP